MLRNSPALAVRRARGRDLALRKRPRLLGGRFDWPVPFAFGLIYRRPAASAEDAGHKICAVVEDFDDGWMFERIEFDPAAEPIESGLGRPVLGPPDHSDWQSSRDRHHDIHSPRSSFLEETV